MKLKHLVIILMFLNQQVTIQKFQSYINNVYKTTESGQFGSDRYAFLFAPGTYSDSLNVEIGFYTQVAGLGLTPTETTVGNIVLRLNGERQKV